MITVRDPGWRQHVRAVAVSALHGARVGILTVISVLVGGRSRRSPSPGRLFGVLGVGLIAAVTGCTGAPTGPSAGGSAGASGAASAGSQPPTVSASGEFAGPVDVGGGRTIYLECHGAGTPTVVLLSGCRERR